MVAGEIERFMEVARHDTRLGPSHFSLYMAIVYLHWHRGGKDCVEVSARVLMPLAKIGSPGPYHRGIRELHAYGYIWYEPSCDARSPSRVWLDGCPTAKQ